MSALPPALRDMREAALQRNVLELLKRTGWLAAHFHDSRREVTRRDGRSLVIGDKAAAGFPDIAATRRDVLLFAELKTEKGKLSPAQEQWLAHLRWVEASSGGLVIVRVWRPSSWHSGEIEQTLLAGTAVNA